MKQIEFDDRVLGKPLGLDEKFIEDALEQQEVALIPAHSSGSVALQNLSCTTNSAGMVA